jgi:SynChlorMet cassette protein ScmC
LLPAPHNRFFGRTLASQAPPRPHLVMPLTAAELDDLLAQADATTGVHASSAMLRLNGSFSWRVMALAGMEREVLLIKDLLELLPANGDHTLYRIILTSTGARNRKAPIVPLHGDRAGTGDGWQHIELPQVDVYTRNDAPDTICDLQNAATDASKDSWLPYVLCPVYLRVIDAGGAILHAASVERDGEAFLLPGKSGTGKSTCCRRIKPPWQALCDDLTLAIPGRNGGFIIHPLPTWSAILWEGEAATWTVERGVPLRAIFFPEHGTEDEALPIGQAEASVQLWRSALQATRPWTGSHNAVNRSRMGRQLLNTIAGVVKSLPAFRLRVAKDGTFWKEMERVLKRV